MKKLTKGQKSFLNLVERSLKGRDWATVSNALWNHAKTLQAQIPHLIELDEETQSVRPTQEGHNILLAMKVL